MSNVGKYNIKAISQLLHVQPGTLRAWERRYKIIAPVRNDAGHRLYTDEHVKVLKWLVAKVNEGFTISQAISLMENKGVKDASPKQGDHVTDIKNDLVTAAIAFDEEKAHHVLDEAFRFYSTEKVIFEIISPMLRKIGELWATGRLYSAQEHFISEIIRSRLGMITQTYSSSSFLPKAVTVCAPDDQHELGLLMFTYYLKKKGFDCTYLGNAIAETDFVEMIKGLNPRFLVFSCTLTESIPKTLVLIEKILKIEPGLICGIGGQASIYLSGEDRQFLIGHTQKDWDKWIVNHL